MSVKEEIDEQVARIKEILTARIEELAASSTDIAEEEAAFIANHYGAMQALEWYQAEHKQ